MKEKTGDDINTYDLDTFFDNYSDIYIDPKLNLKNICEYQNLVKSFIKKLKVFAQDYAMSYANRKSYLELKIQLSSLCALTNIVFFTIPAINGPLLAFFTFNAIFNTLLLIKDRKKAEEELDFIVKTLCINEIRIDALDNMKDYLKNKKLTQDQISDIVSTLYPEVYTEDIENMIENLSNEHNKDFVFLDDEDGVIVATNYYNSIDESKLPNKTRILKR